MTERIKPKKTERFKLSKTAIEAKPSPESGRATYYDTEVPKLAVRVTPAGTKTFYVVKRVGTEMVWLKLGVFPDMTVEKARAEANKALGEFSSGRNPAAIKRATKAELTFSEMFNEYKERHGKKKRSWNTDESNNKNHLQSIANKKLSAITKADVSRILSNLEKAGKAGATINNVRALVSSVYGRAIEWGYANHNPIEGIKTRPKVKRDRFLQSDELPKFFESLGAEPNETLRDYIMLALLTGIRRTNLLEMQWRHINLIEGIWRVPRTKNDEPQNVTLSPEAVNLLTTRKASASDAAIYVFPGDGDTGHIVEPKKAVIRVMNRAGIPYGRKVENGVTLHDLRRTLGSWQAKTGASLAIIGKSLNHKSHQSTQIYARLDLDPVRQSINTATSAMMEAGGVKEKAEVVPLKKRASK